MHVASRHQRPRNAAMTTTTPQDDARATLAEAIREAAIMEEPKHRRLLRSQRDGRVLSGVMVPFLEIWAPAGYGVLTTTGRKSGLQRRKCVRAIRRRGKAFIVQLRP